MEDYPIASSKLTDTKTMVSRKTFVKEKLILLKTKDLILVLYHK